MSVAITIRNQLKHSIESCASVQVVYGYEEVNPSGWPCVFLTSKSMTGEFSSTSENSRIYEYSALVAVTLGQDIETPKTLNRLEYAENIIATVIDEIINAIDDNIVLEGAPVLYIEAADVVWGYTSAEFGVARSAEITLKVYTEVTI